MPTISEWYDLLLEKAESNTNDTYRYHYDYLTKVMRQFCKKYNGQMAYFDGQSTYITARGKICKTTCTADSSNLDMGKIC